MKGILIEPVASGQDASPASSITGHKPESTLEERSRVAALHIELPDSISFIKLGLRQLDSLAQGSAFYHAPMILLATGVERLLKCMILIRMKEADGVLPSKAPWSLKGVKGHDLLTLAAEVAAFCGSFPREYATDDLQLLKHDHRVQQLISSLSEYGTGGRYFNLDSVFGKPKVKDAETSFQRLMSTLAKTAMGEDRYFQVLSSSKSQEIYDMANRELKKLVEQYSRALSRQFVFNTFSSEGDQYMGYLQPFWGLNDDDLGRNSY